MYILKILYLLPALLMFSVTAYAEPWQLVRDEAVILDLLNNGEINLSKDVAKALSMKEGIMQIRRIGLRKGPLQIRAAFRDRVVNMIHSADRYKYFDAFYNELAAYVISRYLGMNVIPITVMREIPLSSQGLKRSKNLNRGTLQIWIENSEVWHKLVQAKVDYPGDASIRKLQVSEIQAFDCIIGNVDRHAGNLLIDMNPRVENIDVPVDQQQTYRGKLWAIDHSRAFHNNRSVRNRFCKLDKLKVQAISLAFGKRLRSWQIDEVKTALIGAGLSAAELRKLNLAAIDARAQKLKTHFAEEQANSNLRDEEFYSLGQWHNVW